VFLAIFHVLPWEFFIFNVCLFSSHIRGPTVCVTFSTFFSFLTNQILPCVFLIFHLCQCFSPYSMSYHVSFCFSFLVSFLAIFQVVQCAIFIFDVFQCFLPYSRTYSVSVSFSTLFSFSSQSWSSHFSCFLLSPALFQVLQCVFLISHVFQFS